MITAKGSVQLSVLGCQDQESHHDGQYKDDGGGRTRIFFLICNSKGDMIPLSAFTTIETRIGAESLTKYNTYVSALISGAAADGYSSGEALNIMAKLIRQNC